MEQAWPPATGTLSHSDSGPATDMMQWGPTSVNGSGAATAPSLNQMSRTVGHQYNPSNNPGSNNFPQYNAGAMQPQHATGGAPFMMQSQQPQMYPSDSRYKQTHNFVER